MRIDPAQLVTAQLAAAGIEPDEDEVAALVAETPRRLFALERLYAVEEAREEEPFLTPPHDPR